MKYLCLAYDDEQLFHDMPRDEWLALRQETLDYVDALRESGHLLSTHPLRSATTATKLRVRDGQLSVTDGPFIETKEQIGGYFLIEASDLDEAIRIAAKWPGARFGTVEVRAIEDGLSTDRRYEAPSMADRTAPAP